MADGATVGVFTIGGAALGWVLKWAESWGASQRRANGKVIGPIMKMRLELNYLNAALADEYQNGNATIKSFIAQRGEINPRKFEGVMNTTLAQQVQAINARKKKHPLAWKDWPELPRFALQNDPDFINREKRLWQVHAAKLEDTVSDCTMQLSARFTDRYWKFYEALVKPDADKWHPFIRYQDAEDVFKTHIKGLKRSAAASIWLVALPYFLVFLAGLVTALLVLVIWPDQATYYAAILAHYASILAGYLHLSASE